MLIKIDKIIRQKRKTLSLRVQDDCSLLIKIPYFLKDKEIDNFIEKNRRWIERVVAEKKNKNALKQQIINNKQILFLGNLYKIVIDDRILQPTFENDKIILSSNFSQQQIEKWLKKQAQELFQKRVLMYSTLMQVKVNKIKLSSAKTRWGTCSSQRNIILNWRLIKAPLSVLDYVVVHELAHIKQMNHSKNFWYEVGKVKPDYKKDKDWLKDNGFLLY